jgi:hypothetical protein
MLKSINFKISVISKKQSSSNANEPHLKVFFFFSDLQMTDLTQLFARYATCRSTTVTEVSNERRDQVRAEADDKWRKGEIKRR